jgi:hypothetical protein
MSSRAHNIVNVGTEAGSRAHSSPTHLSRPKGHSVRGASRAKPYLSPCLRDPRSAQDPVVHPHRLAKGELFKLSCMCVFSHSWWSRSNDVHADLENTMKAHFAPEDFARFYHEVTNFCFFFWDLFSLVLCGDGCGGRGGEAIGKCSSEDQAHPGYQHHRRCLQPMSDLPTEEVPAVPELVSLPLPKTPATGVRPGQPQSVGSQSLNQPTVKQHAIILGASR